MSYYSPGDEVIYANRHDAKVIRAISDKEYVVEFHDKNLIPPQMTVLEGYLKPKPTLWGGYRADEGKWPEYASVNKETHCPRCGSAWKVTHGFKETFHDCIKCNLKREDA